MRRISIQNLLLLSALLLIPLWSYGILLQPLRAQHHYQCQQREQLTMDLLDLREQVRNSQAYLKRFARQPQFREHVLRERLGYAESDELVFIFEDKPQ